MTKDKVLEAINEMPQVFELDDLIEKLIFIEKVEKGIGQLKSNETISHEEVKMKVKSWRK
jgi:hypothetical protein